MAATGESKIWKLVQCHVSQIQKGPQVAAPRSDAFNRARNAQQPELRGKRVDRKEAPFLLGRKGKAICLGCPRLEKRRRARTSPTYREIGTAWQKLKAVKRPFAGMTPEKEEPEEEEGRIEP